MKYTTYHEGMRIVDHTSYLKMREFMCTDSPDNTSEEMLVRKVRFEQDMPQELSGPVPKFSIGMKNRDEEAIYLEKKTKQNNLMYKACVRITREQCQRILRNDIEWMKNHPDPVFAEFYIHCTANALRKAYITESRKEVFPYQDRGYVVFTTAIRRVMKWNADFFDYEENTLDCMNCDRIMVQFKQEATIPQVVANIMHVGADQPAGMLMYAL